MEQTIANEVKQELLKQKLAMWRNTLYSSELDARTAQKLLDAKVEQAQTMLDAATKEVKRCLVAIEFLQDELKELG